eukprot:scaffold384003_cov39-Prasinocladus_malaysianus.AAC.1
MGGVKDPQAEEWVADTAFNNDLDQDAANTVYNFCRQKGISLTVVARDAVPALPMREMREIAQKSHHPVMQYLSNAQDAGLVGLYKRVCAKELPARCTKE